MAGSGSKKQQAKAESAGRLPLEHWKDEPDEHDYPAAAAYLGLVATADATAALVDALRVAPISRGKAKDLLRASRLPLLGADNVHVADDLAKVRRGALLSPVLLVAGAYDEDVPLTVADGYHRICASYVIDENAVVPFRIVERGSAHHG